MALSHGKLLAATLRSPYMTYVRLQVVAQCMSVPDESEALSDVFLDALSDSVDVDVEYDFAP
jgi:hypothetical protein